MKIVSLTSKEFFRENELIAITTSSYLPTIESHKHDFYEIVYVTKGSGYHIINNKRYFISAGSLILVTQGSVHTYYSEQNLQWTNIMFLPQAVNPTLINTDNASRIIAAMLMSDFFEFNVNVHRNNISMIVKEMQLEYDACQNGYQEILLGYLQVLLTMLFRTTLTDSAGGNDDAASREDNLIQTAVTLLSRGEEITPETIARKTFVSPRYFQSLFKKNAGESLTQFKRRYKIEQACRLLEETDMPVSGIMDALNMNDTKNFYAAFKKFTGMTPKQYRTGHRKS
ncbi:MAG: helix-turn-helix domain-containing protein [Clostridia bacterium]|nr:helix-turn-helix domain-containing protein [Clostridia bacterium]